MEFVPTVTVTLDVSEPCSEECDCQTTVTFDVCGKCGNGDFTFVADQSGATYLVCIFCGAPTAA